MLMLLGVFVGLLIGLVFFIFNVVIYNCMLLEFFGWVFGMVLVVMLLVLFMVMFVVGVFVDFVGLFSGFVVLVVFVGFVVLFLFCF